MCTHLPVPVLDSVQKLISIGKTMLSVMRQRSVNQLTYLHPAHRHNSSCNIVCLVVVEVGPLKIQLGGLRERCELPQRSLGHSLSRNRIGSILALEDEI